MTIQEALSEVTDPRRRVGMRVNLNQMLSMVVLANVCGYFGGRPIARFLKAQESFLKEELKLKHSVPSHVTFTDLLNRIDQQEFISAFNKWASFYVPMATGELVSGDGKALASTVTDQHGSNQDFQAIVSIFCQKSGLVRCLKEYRNAKKSEVGIVHYLLKELKNMGITLFLDALHTQKKQ
tara:strand:- start:710 stop:1252 length:543 start_codon:yes stop_codon:yes gene_type:complete